MVDYMPFSWSIRYWEKGGSGRKSGKVKSFIGTRIFGRQEFGLKKKKKRVWTFPIRKKKPLKGFEQSPDCKFLQNSVA